MIAHTQPLQYEYTADGAHRFVLGKASREAVEAYISIMEDIYKRADTKMRLCFWIDASGLSIDFLQYLDYMLERLRPAMARYPQRPAMRTVFIVGRESRIWILDAMFRLLCLKKDQIRYFSPSQQEAAHAWLMSQD
ncbi:MAG: hypothetical protein HXY40_00565 [Chloroflexi bacterium]|nr:hypothetical protein [Chloroflexota bacterium]